eukprot:COSAG05_NODE_18368_length_309_cov_0.990476_1_plen_55_part_10
MTGICHTFWIISGSNPDIIAGTEQVAAADAVGGGPLGLRSAHGTKLCPLPPPPTS